MDEIKIKRLEVFAKHGVFPEENVLGQKFLISATLYCDTTKAGETDELEDSVNYGEVAELVKELTQKTTFHLLERLANYLATNILFQYPMVKKVDMEIEKPWAPVMLSLETVSVKISREWNSAYLSIGSNMGDKRQNLVDAIALLKEDKKIQIVKQSDFIITEPVGYTDQSDFLNGAVELKTLYGAEELLERIHEIEKALKRERKIHWGPRTIDLDIILFNEEIIQTENLIVPHIEMTNRMFVLEPLAQIAPYAVHPVLKKTVLQLKKELENNQ